jgi:hypothetical protein
MTLQDPQRTTVVACEKTVVIWKHPGHLISMKKLLGLCTRRLSLWVLASCSGVGCNRSTGIVYNYEKPITTVMKKVRHILYKLNKKDT